MENKGPPASRPIFQVSFSAVLAAVLVLATAGAAAAAPRESVEQVTSRPGVTQSYYLLEPEQKPRALALVFLGGDGNLALDASGPTRQKGNFLMRVRYDLLRAGLLLAYPDIPSDQGRDIANFRTDRRHAEDMRALIRALKSRADLPVLVIGTSRGTVSAANIAAQVEPELLAGVILTATVFDRTRNRLHSVHDVRLSDIRVPVLELHHKDDACYITLAAGVPGLLRALTNAPRKDTVMLTGGKPPKSDPCEGLSQHGFFGVEDQAVKAMTEWIDSVLAGR